MAEPLICTIFMFYSINILLSLHIQTVASCAINKKFDSLVVRLYIANQSPSVCHVFGKESGDHSVVNNFLDLMDSNA